MRTVIILSVFVVTLMVGSVIGVTMGVRLGHYLRTPPIPEQDGRR